MAEKVVYPKLNAQILEGFATSCLTPYYDEASQFANFHREWWEICCSNDKFIAIAAPRGHSKSTTITISYALATVLFRERRYVLLVADTEAQAALFLGTIKQILYDSERIHQLFGLEKGPKGVVFEKDSETDQLTMRGRAYASQGKNRPTATAWAVAQRTSSRPGTW